MNHLAPLGLPDEARKNIGNGDSLPSFWFPEAPEAAPGIASSGKEGVSAHGSMYHVAFDVPEERIEEYREKLRAKGVAVTEVVNHDDSPRQWSGEMQPGVLVRSIYFRDADGITLEFAAWTRDLGPEDLRHAPATERDVERYRRTREAFCAAGRPKSGGV